MSSRERWPCSECAQPAEVRCDCQALLCTQCISKHDSRHPDASAVYLPLEIGQNLIQADSEICRLTEVIQSLAGEVNFSVDSAVGSLEAMRQYLLAQVEQVRAQYLVELRQGASELRDPGALREAEVALGNIKAVSAPVVEYSINLKKSVDSFISQQVLSPQREPQALNPEPANLLYCVKPQTKEIYAFNPTTEKLSEVPVVCDKRLSMNGSYCYVPPASLYYCGGWNRASEVAAWFLIDLGSGRVVSSGPMKASRTQHAVVHLSSKVFIFGGYANRKILNSCEKFEIAYSTQSQIASMSQKLNKIGAVVLQQKVYITGYKQKEEPIGNFIEVYDTTQDRFSQIPFQLPTNSCTIGFAIDNCLGFLRGSTLLVYDLRTGNQQKVDVDSQRYATCTCPVVDGLKVYYLVCTDEKYAICCFDWQKKKNREIENLTHKFL